MMMRERSLKEADWILQGEDFLSNNNRSSKGILEVLAEE